jgi:S1-C subfamily serine protease
LIDSLGNVIWINTAININWQNIWFAIPINTAISWLYSLIKK